MRRIIAVIDSDCGLDVYSDSSGLCYCYGGGWVKGGRCIALICPLSRGIHKRKIHPPKYCLL